MARLTALGTGLLLLLPEAAAACPSCISAPYGDRTFNWAFWGLLLMPFAVACVIAGVLAIQHRRRSAPPARDLITLSKETT